MLSETFQPFNFFTDPPQQPLTKLQNDYLQKSTQKILDRSMEETEKRIQRLAKERNLKFLSEQKKPISPETINKGVTAYGLLADAMAGMGGIGERESGGLRAPGFAPTTSAALAGLGTTIAPGIGTLVGAGVGLAFDTARFITGRKKYKEDLYRQGILDNVDRNRRQSGLDYTGLRTFESGKGGNTYASGRSIEPVKVEDGEATLDEQGNIKAIYQGANHQQGGIDAQVTNDQTILSKESTQALQQISQNNRFEKFLTMLKSADQKDRMSSASVYNSGNAAGKGKNKSMDDDIYDLASAVNAITFGSAMLNDRSGDVRVPNITPTKITPDTTAFDNIERNTRQQYAGQLKSLEKQMHSDAGRMALASMAGANLNKLSSDLSAQKNQYLTQIKQANQQTNQATQQANQSASMQQQQLNSQLDLQDAQIRSTAASSALQGVLANQLAKRQSRENALKAKYDTAVNQTILAHYLNEDLLASPQFKEYYDQRKNQISQEILSELGDAKDTANPLYQSEEFTKFVLDNKDSFTQRTESLKSQLSEQVKAIDEAIAGATDPQQISALNAQKKALEEQRKKLDNTRGLMFETFYQGKYKKAFNDRFKTNSIKHEYLNEYGIQMPNLNEVFKRD